MTGVFVFKIPKRKARKMENVSQARNTGEDAISMELMVTFTTLK